MWAYKRFLINFLAITKYIRFNGAVGHTFAEPRPAGTTRRSKRIFLSQRPVLSLECCIETL